MKIQLLIVLVIVVFFVSSKVTSQELEKTEKLDEVVVTATKFELKKEYTGKIIYKISKQEIENNAGKTVEELLNNLPGVEINAATSNRGHIKGVYVRGGRSRQNLVLIDGIPVFDASGVNQEFDLRLLSLNQIEFIEVLKGASSVLYGTGAATGVINIILKKSSKKNFKATYQVSLGTNGDAVNNDFNLGDRNQNLSISGTSGKMDYLAYASLTGTNGLSASKSKTGKKFEDDNYYGFNKMAKIGYKINDDLKIYTFLNYDKFDADYDLGAYKDNSVNNSESIQVRYGVKSNYKYKSGEIYALISSNTINRDLMFFNSSLKKTQHKAYKGTGLNFDIVNKIQLLKNRLQVITGVNYQEYKNQTNTLLQSINIEQAIYNTIDPYLSVIYISNFGVNISAGGRYNIHSKYGNHLVNDVNISYNMFKDKSYYLKLLATYGTAFIAPSTYQLFSEYGNINIDPETSSTLELGFESRINKNIKFNAVYFKRRVQDGIVFESLSADPWGIYVNSKKEVKTKGIEAMLEAKLYRKIYLNANYTYIYKSSDVNYIPTNKIAAAINTKIFKNTFMSLVYKNVGKRTYFDKWGSFGPSGNNIVLEKYNLLDFNANYKILEGKVILFGSVTNLLNEDFEEVLGFSTRNRNFKLGISLNF